LFSFGFFASHHVLNGLVELRLIVQGAVLVVLDAHPQESIRVRLILIHISGGHRGIKPREGKAGRDFKHRIRG